MDRRSFAARAALLCAAPLVPRLLEISAQTTIHPALDRFKLGAISDEFSQDFEHALTAMHGYGLRWVELRTLWNTYNTELSPNQLRKVKDLLQRNQMQVSVVDSALFKCTLPGTEPVVNQKDAYPYGGQMDLLKRAIDRAHALGTDKVRVFSFWRVRKPKESTQRIADELLTASDTAQSAGIRLVLENESSCNVATGHELANMLKRVNALNLGANWDVGNGWWQGEVSYPNGYYALDPSRIWHMHLKDVRCDKPGRNCRTVVVGQGENNLAGQLRALLAARYSETMSLEPEVEQPGLSHEQATRQSLVALLGIMDQAFAARK
jgi:sugar phosphate isomerase/epimerase